MRSLIIGMIALLLLPACKDTKQQENIQPVKNTKTAEPLLGVLTNYDSSTVSIFVVSNGCTSKGDFSLTYRNDTLLVTRTKPDYCKMVPHTVNFNWTFQEAGILPNKPIRSLHR